MEIPYQSLDELTLKNLVEEFVSREGTDYGLEEYSLEDKVAQVIRQLEAKQARIVYDAESKTCNIESTR